MIADKLFFDIETLPTVDPSLIADIASSISPPGSMKKPETISAWEANEKPAAILEAVRKTSLDGGTGRLASICWACGAGEILGAHTADDGHWSEAREIEILQGFFQEATAFGNAVGGAVLTGHNVLNFDLRWIWKRAIVLGVAVPDWWPLNARPWSDTVCDTMTMWEGATGRISQDRLGRILGVGGKGDIDGSMVAGMWDAGEHDKILDYCGDDVRKSRRIWARITQFDGQSSNPSRCRSARWSRRRVRSTGDARSGQVGRPRCRRDRQAGAGGGWAADAGVHDEGEGGMKARIDIERLRSLAEAGYADKEIAAVLGFSVFTIVKYRNRNRIAPGVRRLWTDDEILTIDRMIAIGADDAEIGLEIDRTASAVSRVRHELGIEKLRKFYVMSKRAEAERMEHVAHLQARKRSRRNA